MDTQHIYTQEAKRERQNQKEILSQIEDGWLNEQIVGSIDSENY
jgi:hypothetical protein